MNKNRNLAITTDAKDHFAAVDNGLIWMRDSGMTYKNIGARFGAGAARAQQLFKRAKRNNIKFLKANVHIAPLLEMLR